MHETVAVQPVFGTHSCSVRIITCIASDTLCNYVRIGGQTQVRKAMAWALGTL
jgi:hypothetical protein